MKTAPNPKAVEKTVAELRLRIRDDREYIARYEARTRVVLIDPLLRAIGWDPENSRDVQIEFRGVNGRFDYALMSEGKPVAVIEAKKLMDDLDSPEVDEQITTYARDPKSKGIHLLAITDGDEWVFHLNNRDCEVVTVTVSSGQPAEIASHLSNFLSPSMLGVRVVATSRRGRGRRTRPRRAIGIPRFGRQTVETQR